MWKEELEAKLRGVKALLYMCSNTTDEIEDQQYGFSLLGDIVAECIDELEESEE